MSNASLSPEHQDFYERFKSFWAAPSGDRVAELIAPEATIHFTGAGFMTGAQYAAWMGEALPTFEDMTVTPMDCAGNGEILYIAWEASARLHGEQRTYRGVDRFRIKDGMAIEEHVIFDSAVLTPEGRGGIEQKSG
ncbi:nuclear transport factor 2 family protein [Erythrobacter sp. F6033]|uniref:nuclear transport factor 2 family protein n=1 Tax=Erythrobacter sp. F6033 TaxID=2926401 RepID=UPI001FF56255|nr:nuclear transport factor 2 family protein [Erythrobacter sp. F6033]MCK0129462.1 nuclear transport factor 2 family protein [Erythrobacter sp. F6033]